MDCEAKIFILVIVFLIAVAVFVLVIAMETSINRKRLIKCGGAYYDAKTGEFVVTSELKEEMEKLRDKEEKGGGE